MLTGVTLEQRIRSVLSAGGSSLAKFAAEAGIHRQTFYAAFKREKETGAHNLDEATAATIAKHLGKSVPWVRHGEGEEPPAARVDTLSLADQAARKLAEDLQMSADAAWKAMRGLTVSYPSEYELYRAARTRLERKRLQRAESAENLSNVGERLDPGTRLRLSSRPPPQLGRKTSGRGKRKVSKD